MTFLRSLARRALPALVLGSLAAAAVPTCADVIRLKNGETIKGRVVVERSNEQVLVVEDYVTGGVREFSWDAVDPDELPAGILILRPAGGGKQELSVPCEVISVRQLDGSTFEIRGVVRGEEGGFLLVKTRASKDPMRVEKTRVVSREPADCAPEDVDEPSELFAKMKADLDPQDARTWLRLAIYGEQVGAFAEAKEAYEMAAADETFLQRAAALAGATRTAAVIKDKEAYKTLADLRNQLAFLQFPKVREGIDGFLTKHPDASEGVKRQLETLKTAFTQKRAEAFARRAGKELVDLLKVAISKKVSPKDAAYNDVMGWARKDAVDGAFKELTDKFQVRDPVVTLDETRTFFDARPKKAGAWRYAKYGSGSFLIEPPKVKPPSGGNRPPPRPQKGGGPVPNIKIPKPPTRDEWWAAASGEDRTQFWLASIAEKSGIFDVAPQRERVACSLCNGEGLIHKVTSNGQDLTYLCNRCGGAQYDLTVKFR